MSTKLSFFQKAEWKVNGPECTLTSQGPAVVCPDSHTSVTALWFRTLVVQDGLFGLRRKYCGTF